MTEASALAATYDLVVIGGGPAGLAAASLAARAGLSTVLFDENPGVGGQIYRGITATPVTDRAVLGEDYWAGSALAGEAKASGAELMTGATVWSLDPSLQVGVSIAGSARLPYCLDIWQHKRMVFSVNYDEIGHVELRVFEPGRWERELDSLSRASAA